MKTAICGSEPLGLATPTNFCAIFTQDKDSLYTLALLLTADHTRAEFCFVAALDDCLSGISAFQEWARSWSRRAVIKNAIRLMAPRPGDGNHTSSNPAAGDDAETESALGSITSLRPFDRFVFVMSVLEKYPDQECVALLKCFPHEVPAARNRALRNLAGAPAGPQAGLHRGPGPAEPGYREAYRHSAHHPSEWLPGMGNQPGHNPIGVSPE